MCITHNTIEKKWFRLNRWVGVCGDVCLEQHKVWDQLWIEEGVCGRLCPQEYKDQPWIAEERPSPANSCKNLRETCLSADLRLGFYSVMSTRVFDGREKFKMEPGCTLSNHIHLIWIHLHLLVYFALKCLVLSVFITMVNFWSKSFISVSLTSASVLSYVRNCSISGWQMLLPPLCLVPRAGPPGALNPCCPSLQPPFWHVACRAERRFAYALAIHFQRLTPLQHKTVRRR